MHCHCKAPSHTTEQSNVCLTIFSEFYAAVKKKLFLQSVHYFIQIWTNFYVQNGRYSRKKNQRKRTILVIRGLFHIFSVDGTNNLKSVRFNFKGLIWFVPRPFGKQTFKSVLFLNFLTFNHFWENKWLVTTRFSRRRTVWRRKFPLFTMWLNLPYRSRFISENVFKNNIFLKPVLWVDI